MKVKIGFSTTNSWFSRAFRWFMGAQTSHCYIRMYDEFLDAPMILHADYPGVLFEHADYFDQTNVVIEEFEIDDDRLNKGIKKNLMFLRNAKYDWWNIFNLALILKLDRWFKRKLKKPLENPKKFICVDFVAKILNDSGITHLPIGDLHTKRLRAWFNLHYEKFGWKKETF